jgi:hypothetical protein
LPAPEFLRARFDAPVVERLASFMAANNGMSLSPALTSRTSCPSTASTARRASSRRADSVSTRTFPQDRSYISAISSALAALLSTDANLTDQVIFLARH